MGQLIMKKVLLSYSEQ